MWCCFHCRLFIWVQRILERFSSLSLRPSFWRVYSFFLKKILYQTRELESEEETSKKNLFMLWESMWYWASRAVSFSHRKNVGKKTYNGGKFHATFCSQERKRAIDETRGFVYALIFHVKNWLRLIFNWLIFRVEFEFFIHWQIHWLDVEWKISLLPSNLLLSYFIFHLEKKNVWKISLINSLNFVILSTENYSKWEIFSRWAPTRNDECVWHFFNGNSIETFKRIIESFSFH